MSAAMELDRRYMAAAIRLSRRNLGLTSTNPSVGTLIVRDDGLGARIIGRGITAVGGRPHAEAEALTEAGAEAHGAVAYVTLEPCAHHGRTPPCAEALVRAGLSRVIGAATDPDARVAGKGYASLEAAGIEVAQGVLARAAEDLLGGYLMRAMKKRPEVTLKLAVSADGHIGRSGQGQIEITGSIARRQVHRMRAETDAILVGIGTALDDDPELTCRLPGVGKRSPLRIVLDRDAKLPSSSKLAATARRVPVLLATSIDADSARRAVLEDKGVGFIGCDVHEGSIALPELMDDLAARGVSTLLVEGGAETARRFLAENLVDRLIIFQGRTIIGSDGILSPVDPNVVPEGFALQRRDVFGNDICREFVRID